jgi:exodeoxyribonuclease V alpha subunit
MSGIIPTSIQIANQSQIFDGMFEGNTILGELKDMELDIYKNDEKPYERVISHFLKHYDIVKDILEVQIITALRVRGNLSNYTLNNKIQEILNPILDDDIYVEVKLAESTKDEEKYYRLKLGDKVINTQNNYKTEDVNGRKIPIFNGNMGIITDIDYNSCVVDFIGIGEIVLGRNEIKKLELGYAISCFKAQGSQFHTVICAFDSSAYMLLNAELLYTAITRAKKYCVLVAQNSAIRIAINKRESKIKQTHLKNILQSKNTKQ